MVAEEIYRHVMWSTTPRLGRKVVDMTVMVNTCLLTITPTPMMMASTSTIMRPARTLIIVSGSAAAKTSCSSARGFGAARRTFSSSQSWDAEPVNLSYDVVEPTKASASSQSLVICHGLLYVLCLGDEGIAS